MQTELECRGCDTKHAAARAHCLNRGVEQRLSNALKML
jgi:hypothetical protein